MICMFISTSCEKTDIQKPTALKHIEGRSCPITDCDECPDDDCCCSVELLSATPTTLHFCGTSGPCLSTMTCNVGGLPNCPDISGFDQSISLNQFQTTLFCVPKNAPFGITSASGTPTVRVSCQVGQTSQQFVTITLNTPPDKPYWSTNDNCFLTDCF